MRYDQLLPSLRSQFNSIFTFILLWQRIFWNHNNGFAIKMSVNHMVTFRFVLTSFRCTTLVYFDWNLHWHLIRSHLKLNPKCFTKKNCKRISQQQQINDGSERKPFTAQQLSKLFTAYQLSELFTTHQLSKLYASQKLFKQHNVSTQAKSGLFFKQANDLRLQTGISWRRGICQAHEKHTLW